MKEEGENMAVSFFRLASVERKAALTAGVSLVLMAAAAAFSYGFVYGKTVSEEADATVAAIQSVPALFVAGIAGWFVVVLCDITAMFGLYFFFRQSQRLSLIAAGFRLCYTALLFGAVLNLIWVYDLAGTAEHMPAAVHKNQITLLLNRFQLTWSAGLIVFGVHLWLLSRLCRRSGVVPKTISFLLAAGAAGYGLIHAVNLLFPEYEALVRILTTLFMLPMTVGELGLGFWFLFRGGKTAAAKKIIPISPAV